MSNRRLGAALALLVLLAGPLGLLAVEHGAFHALADHDGHRVPCPVCHFLKSTAIAAPTLGNYLPVLVLVDEEPLGLAHAPAAGPTFAPRRSRAPPSLLS